MRQQRAQDDAVAVLSLLEQLDPWGWVIIFQQRVDLRAVQRHLDGVVVAEVEEGSIAEEKRVRAGEIIVSVNGADVATPADVAGAMAKAMEDDRKAVLLQLRAGENSRFVALPIEKG